MKKLVALFIVLSFVFGLNSCLKEVPEKNKKKKVSQFGIVIHGGAGYMKPEWYSPEQQKAYKDKLAEALKTGYKILSEGGKAVDAVEAAINVLEDSPLFNAGKGAVFTAEGKNELDASIMDGSDLNCGAVAGVTVVKNPISLARVVMDSSKHVFLAREGAEKYAKKMGLEIVKPEYFFTQHSWDALQRTKGKNKKEKASVLSKTLQNKFGTVGCVALDKNGNLAAGTSTGGMTNKEYGRIGDSPVIGAGTYANNKTCAVSATGHGEFFIRNVVTHDISALMEYKDLSLEKACNEVVMNKLKKVHGDGGVIAIDKFGNVSMTFNTPGMFRGFMLDDGKAVVKIFGDDKK